MIDTPLDAYLKSQAYNALRVLSKKQRMRVFCWFCFECGRHVGPGEKACVHTDDDEDLLG